MYKRAGKKVLALFLTIAMVTGLLPAITLTVSAADGDTWTARTSGVSAHILSVCYGNNTFVAVGSGGTILTSSNGSSWVNKTSASITGNNLFSVCTNGAGTFVATGASGTLITSTDNGATWTSQNFGAASYARVDYGNNLFMAFFWGQCYTSTDGLSWIAKSPTDGYDVYGQCYQNIGGVDTYVAGGYPDDFSDPNGNYLFRFLTSTDNGESFYIDNSIRCTGENINSICYGNGNFLAVGDGGVIVTSPTGYGWTVIPAGISYSFQEVLYDSGTSAFWAVGWGGCICTSSDGSSWTSKTSSTTKDLYGICYGNGTFVAVGLNGTILTSDTAAGNTPITSYSTEANTDLVMYGWDFFDDADTKGLGSMFGFSTTSNIDNFSLKDYSNDEVAFTDSYDYSLDPSIREYTKLIFNSSIAGTYNFALIRFNGNCDELDRANVTITVTGGNTPPTVSINTGVTLNEGNSVTIGSAKLTTTDAQTTDASLITYTLTTAPTRGTLYKGSTALSANSTFTQSDINNSSITYTHNGGETTSDSFGFSVSDGVDAITGQTFNITVTPVNDAPLLVAQAPSLTPIAADDTNNVGQTVASFIGTSISDNDNGALQGIAITSSSNGNGAWQYSTNSGASWNSMGTVLGTSALLLRSEDKIRFVPNGSDGTSASITYKAWDRTSGTQGSKVDASSSLATASFSSVTDTASITVNGVNHAPNLTPSSPMLESITEDNTTNAGQTVASFVGASISDVDSGEVEGIAITAVSGNGTWQYSVVENIWTNIGIVSGSSAMLLNDTDKIRFVPNGQNGESASITYRAWDRTSGTVYSKVDASTFGGKTAFSTATDTANITVTSINDAPLLSANTPTLTSITEDNTANAGQTVASFIGASISDVDSGSVNGIAITAVTSGNGTWEYSIDNGSTWNSIGAVSVNGAMLLNDTDKIRFVPNGQSGTTASITYRAWDTTTGTEGSKADASANGGTTAFSTATDTAAITVTDVNDVPTLSSISKLTGAGKNTAFTITYADLADSADEADIDSGNISFLIAAVKSNGTLTKSGMPVTAGTTTLSAGESLVWTPNTYGTDIESFTVKAYDGAASSANAVAVTIDVANEIAPAPTANPITGSTVKRVRA